MRLMADGGWWPRSLLVVVVTVEQADRVNTPPLLM
jgi:hypothetical protein